ncbi:MAG: HlyD family efflux transporter periplasmic adaptor subunit [Bacteroidales bacterium]|nr:HlyD family efflux transporter periplasmic adaptor subunit [Bacteroidales bacterium]
MRNKTKTVILIIVVLVTACSENDDKSDAYGNFEATEVVISAEAQGVLQEFIIEEGEELKSGTVIGLIDTINLSLKREQLLAGKKAILSRIVNINSQVAVQEQQKENIIIEKDRIERLLKDGAATRKQMDDVMASLRLINSQVKSLETQKTLIKDEAKTIDVQIAQVEENIKKCYLVNPVEGTVLTKIVEEKEVVSIGKPMYIIADLSKLELKAYISGSQLPHIRIGQEVEVLIDYDVKSNQKMTGVVSWISQQAEFTPKIIQTKEERVNLVYAVKILVKNDGSIKIGMPGEVNFMPKTASNK